jgi:hypothetical protein
MTMNEAELDALLSAELAPPERPADMLFVGRMDRTIAEAERYRASRAALKRQLGTEAAAIGALGASLALLGQAPEVRAFLSDAPGLLFTALAGLMLVWLLIGRSRFGALA